VKTRQPCRAPFSGATVFSALGLIAALFLGNAAQANDNILIGQSAPLTGSNAEFGNDIRNGALAYFNKVNAAGGIGGRKIELITLDDRNDRKTAGKNAEKLVNENKVSALFGFASATLSLDAMPVVADKKVPFVAPFTGADVMRKQSPYVFTLRASYEEELGKILSFWSSLGIDRITVIHYDDEVGNQNFKTVADFMQKSKKQSTGIKIKRNAAVDPAIYERIVASDPQIVVITTLFGPAAEIVKELRSRNRPYMYSSLSFVGASQLAKVGGADANGISVAAVVPLPTNMSVPVVKECDDAIRKIPNATLTFTSLEACIGTKVLVEAMKKGGKDVSRDSLYRGLQALGSYDAGGYLVNLGPKARHGSSFVDLAVISKSGGFRS
jgi:branched-chain amino acid transport system substrate-binding protein